MFNERSGSGSGHEVKGQEDRLPDHWGLNTETMLLESAQRTVALDPPLPPGSPRKVEESVGFFPFPSSCADSQCPTRQLLIPQLIRILPSDSPLTWNERRFVRFLLIFSAFALFPCVALAYVDPGTGSYIFQLLLAGLLGALYLLRQYWSRVKSFARSLFGKRSPDGEA